jgi:putative transcriptional regulator
MLRVRLKAAGRIVEILPDGSEGALPSPLAEVAEQMRSGRPAGGWAAAARAARGAAADATYARGVRARTKLTQAQFAARIGVPIETVRNWEQGKRSPRGPARALLKVIDAAPDVAFAVLSTVKAPQ